MTTLVSGQMLGAYRIIEQIGQGGMATVYKAYHAAMDRYVAIKILPFQFAQTEEFIERFQREVRVIAHLEHPHILPVYDSGESGGVPYLVMRFMDTGTLKERIQAGQLSLEDIDRLFTQLADALGYAHTNGVIHRDIKPSNVLLDARGDVFLTDFGIARLVESATQLTASGSITGTPAYMSPEQAQGEVLDARSDIYSLGIVLYEMITGLVPFEAETPLAVMLKHLQASLPLPSTIKEGLDPAIERVLLKALARDRAERFNSTGELITAWKEAMEMARQEKKVAVAPSPTPRVAPSPAPPIAPSPAAPVTPSKERAKKPYLKWIAAGAFIVILILLMRGVLLRRVRNTLATRASTLAPATLTARVLIAAPDITAVTESAGQEMPSTTPQPGETIEPTTQDSSSEQDSSSDLAIKPGVSPPGWESWTGANTILAITYHAGKIYSGGPGGITIWDPADGSFERITTRDGLPGPLVWALYFDDDGILWVGTDAGLGRFDGNAEQQFRRWLSYSRDEGLDSTTIMAIERYQGNLVVGTSYCGEDGCGLNVFNGRTWKPIPNFPSSGEDPNRFRWDVTALLADEGRGGLWVGTPNGLGWHDGQKWKRYTTADGLPDDAIHTLIFDRDGNLLIGTGGGAALYNGQKFTSFENLAGYDVNGIVQDNDGRYWFGGWDGVTRFDPATATWDTFNPNTSTQPAFVIRAATKDEKGNLFFGSDQEGLIRFDGDFTAFKIPNAPLRQAFWRILAAPTGQLWFLEEYGLGIDIFDPESGLWSVGPILPCIPLAFDAEGSLWGGSENGLWIINRETQTNLTTRHGLPSDMVTALAFGEDHRVWVGTEAGLAVLDGQTVVEVLTAESTGFASDLIHSIYKAKDGSIWVVTEGGLSRRNPAGSAASRTMPWEHYGRGNPFSEDFYNASHVAEDALGQIWVATLGDGIYRLSEGQWSRFIPTDPGVKLPSFDITNLTVAPDGSLWFATDKGVAHLNGTKWTSFGVAEGLIYPFVNAIYVEPSGAVWFATSGGVSRYIP